VDPGGTCRAHVPRWPRGGDFQRRGIERIAAVRQLCGGQAHGLAALRVRQWLRRCSGARSCLPGRGAPADRWRHRTGAGHGRGLFPAARHQRGGLACRVRCTADCRQTTACIWSPCS
jgi:hypothetical protein